MSTPLQEHDYIGLSETPSMENSENKEKNIGLNLKATELRLGLPGSESPEREIGHVAVMKCLVSGAKRGYIDTIGGGSGKWVFSGIGGAEADLAKNGGFFSPRSVNGGGSEIVTLQSSVASTSVKEAALPQPVPERKPQISASNGRESAPAAKAQVVGWPPVRSFRKNSMASNHAKKEDDADANSGSGCLYIKVSMDGAPYLRKVDLKLYGSYAELSSALEKMFSCFTIGRCGSDGVPSRDGLMSESRLMDLLHGSEYILTYQDKDGDWMLVGDVPWDMFTDSCKRLRIMKSSDAIGLAPRVMEKFKNRN